MYLIRKNVEQLGDLFLVITFSNRSRFWRFQNRFETLNLLNRNNKRFLFENVMTENSKTWFYCDQESPLAILRHCTYMTRWWFEHLTTFSIPRVEKQGQHKSNPEITRLRTVFVFFRNFANFEGCAIIKSLPRHIRFQIDLGVVIRDKEWYRCIIREPTVFAPLFVSDASRFLPDLRQNKKHDYQLSCMVQPLILHRAHSSLQIRWSQSAPETGNTFESDIVPVSGRLMHEMFMRLSQCVWLRSLATRAQR